VTDETYAHQLKIGSSKNSNNDDYPRKLYKSDTQSLTFKSKLLSAEGKLRMDFFEVVRNRRSIRKYRPEAIPNEKLKKIFEATRMAPSADNRQPWHFVVVQESDRKKALARAANNQMFLRDAAAIVAGVADPDVSARWHEKDTMIALEHMVLAAAALGYGTCWIGAFDEDAVKRLLKIPARMRVVALLPIGIPDETPGPTQRKELREIFFRDEWQTPWPGC
jgi:nitroreductase